MSSFYLYDPNSSINTLNKNITSYRSTMKSNFYEDSYKLNHIYIQDNIQLEKSIEEYRYDLLNIPITPRDDFKQYLTEEEKKKQYSGEEDNIYCGRFPHLSYCGCNIPCALLLIKIDPIEVIQNVFVGPIESAFKVKQLLDMKITYILNLSCTEYKKRIKYFKYLDIFINDNHTENAIKFFKITNRFIDEAVKTDKRILIHSVHGRSRCWVFLMAYLIGKSKMKFLAALELIKAKFPYAEPNENFLTQLKHYDLEVNI